MRVLYFLIFSLLGHYALAQYDSTVVSLSTDRPTQTATSQLLKKGEWQIETGYAISQFEAFDIILGNPPPDVLMEQPTTVNITQIRYGLTNGVELNFSQSVSKIRFKRGSTVQRVIPSEFTPTSLAVRVHLAEAKGIRPQLAVLTGFTGSPFDGGEDDWAYNFRVAASQSIVKRLSLGYNLGFDLVDEYRNLTGLYTVVLTYELAKRFFVFGEMYGTFPRIGQAEHSFDYGAMYLVNNNIQLDVFGGFGVSERAPDTLFGCGLSVRIPKR